MVNTLTKSEKDDSLSTLATPLILANKRVPAAHRSVADYYIVIKRLYKSQTVRANLVSNECSLLEKYHLHRLSSLSIQEVNKEILMLQEWAFSSSDVLRHDSDLIIQIRAKELRYILSSNYSRYSSEINDGYKALERYFEEITKFYNLPH